MAQGGTWSRGGIWPGGLPAPDPLGSTSGDPPVTAVPGPAGVYAGPTGMHSCLQ